MSSEALTSSTEDKEEEWLWGCAAERGWKENQEIKNKTEKEAPLQQIREHPAKGAFYMKMLCKL